MKVISMDCITLSPLEFKEHLQYSPIFYSFLETPAGILMVLETNKGIFKACFMPMKQEFPEYTKKQNPGNRLIMIGTAFQKLVWQRIAEIPLGQTRSYKEIAVSLSKPKAYRAVAQACARNSIAYFIPCHRVIGTKGDIQGYAWGNERKEKLLAAEQPN